jgi:hypothetical protein
MAAKNRSGQHTASRSGTKKSGQNQRQRGAKGHAETPTPRTPPLSDDTGDASFAAADENDGADDALS